MYTYLNNGLCDFCESLFTGLSNLQSDPFVHYWFVLHITDLFLESLILTYSFCQAIAVAFTVLFRSFFCVNIDSNSATESLVENTIFMELSVRFSEYTMAVLSPVCSLKADQTYFPESKHAIRAGDGFQRFIYF